MKVDLEHFPTSPTAQRMMSRISPIYDKSYLGKWIFEVMSTELDGTHLRYDELRLQAFPETVTWAISYWEQAYDITPKPMDTLEERRRALVAKRNMKAPMNPARIELILSNMTGKPVQITENVAPYTFSVSIQDVLGSYIDLNAALKRLMDIKPSHQTFWLFFEAQDQKEIIQWGGVAASIITWPAPEVAENYQVEQSIRTGGATSVIYTYPATELPEAFGVKSAIRIGGEYSSKVSFPALQQNDQLIAQSEVHLGGKNSIISTFD